MYNVATSSVPFMEILESINQTEGVSGSVVLQADNTVVRSSFDSDQTAKIVKAVLPFIQRTKKVLKNVQIGSVRSARREIVFAVDADKTVIV